MREGIGRVKWMLHCPLDSTWVRLSGGAFTGVKPRDARLAQLLLRPVEETRNCYSAQMRWGNGGAQVARLVRASVNFPGPILRVVGNLLAPGQGNQDASLRVEPEESKSVCTC